ncbi:MAG TPA: phosphotransferase [Mycobacteriales bacterium]|nr:phosphotransferase [Mycobacteriales bacterium]
MTDDIQDGGNRPAWSALPDPVRSLIESMVGRVHATRPARGGFSPGFASVLEVAGGQRVFVKAISDDLTPRATELYRQDHRICAALPPSVPTPRLLEVREDYGWIVLAFEFADGRIPSPTRPADLEAMLETYARLAEVLDPSPLPLETFESRWNGRFDEWSGSDVDGIGERFSWAGANLPLITKTAENWRIAVRGNALVHGDLRADNMILTTSGMLVVDWPESCIGAPWLDLVLALPSLAMFANGPDPEDVVRTHPVTAAVDPGHLDAVVAALAGFFAVNSLRPPPPGLPTLRRFQHDQAEVALAWLRQRVG